MDLAQVHQRAIEAIQSQMIFLSAGYPMREVGGEIEDLSRLFQGLGICHLLEFLDAEQFRQNLIRSGHARRFFLQMSRGQGNTDSKYLALSRSEVFLDVLAAGDIGVAEDIANLSSQNFHGDWEYEDDFRFYQYLQRLILPAPGDLGDVLKRFEAALQGEQSTRLNVCRALEARNSSAFESALSALLKEEEERADAARSKVVDSQYLFWPRSFISIEGLALLRAGELVGLSVETELPLCPMEARLPVTKDKARDFFAELATLTAN